jgi:hypothetical protein
MTVVKCAAGVSEPFEVEVGLHQGSALSPFLFIMIMDVLTEEIRKEAPWQMMFADDVFMCESDQSVLETELEKWREALEKRGMRVSRSKTEYMCLHGRPQGSIKLQGQELKEVSEFKYLGNTVQGDGGVEAEVNRRIQSGWNNWRKMSAILCDKRAPLKVKGRIHMRVVQPAMLYGMETVPLGSRHVAAFEVAERKMCRWARGLTRYDHVRNVDIEKKLQIDKSISTRLQISRLRWYGHVKRREDNYMCKRVLEMAPPGKRKRGRPKLRWIDSVRQDMKTVGAQETDVHDRARWRKLISTAATPLKSGNS